MPNAEAIKLDSMMKKVEALLARADHPNTPPEEADTARMMAERIMVKYKIDQEEMLKRGDLKVDQFNVLFKEVDVTPYGNEFFEVYRTMVAYATHHCDVLGVWKYRDGHALLEMIGYEADIRYAEALFMQARLVFADRMEPKYDPSLSDEDNVYRMRSAGMERIRVAKIMGWEKGGAKVTRLYKAACAKRGEDPALTGQGTSVKDFREAYKVGFLNELWQRLYNAKNAVESELDSGGIVLHGRKERIRESMYERYPHLRPGTEPVKANAKPVRPLKWTKADQRKAERMHSGGGRAGMQAGKRAASEININQGTPKRRLSE